MKRAGPPQPVTERELEMLQWTSEGKTAIEVSMIMGVTVSTVHYELSRAARKLNAYGKTHAVANALRRELIT